MLGRPGGAIWISAPMQAAYCRLHELGFAHSVETWLDDRLVGGLYGVRIGAVFFGESMFSRATDASKVALVHLVARLNRGGAVDPVAAYRAAGYRRKVAEERPAVVSGGGGIV